MTIQTFYLDLTLPTAEELKQIPKICDEHSLIILSKIKVELENGTYNEKMPFLIYSSEFKLFWCTFIRHSTKTEVSFEEFCAVVSGRNEKAIQTAKTVQEKAESILSLLNEIDLTDDQKLEILSTTRERLEKNY